MDRETTGLEGEERLCAAVSAGTEELLQRVCVAYEEHGPWRDRLRAVAREMLRFLQEDHERARLMTVEVLAAGDRAQLIRDQGMQGLIELIDQGRQELEDPGSVSRATAEGIGGAIYNRMHVAIAAGDYDALDSMVPELMYNAVLPYLGTEAALEELDIAASAFPTRRERGVSPRRLGIPSG